MPSRIPALARLPALLYALLALLGAVLAWRLVRAAPFSGADSWFAMGRALDYLRAGGAPGALYDTLLFAQHVKFQYPTSSLLLLQGLSAIGLGSYAQLNALNAVVLVAASLALALYAAKLVGPAQWRGLAVPVAPLAFIVGLKFYPAHLAFALGQVQVLLGLLVTLAALALLAGRNALAGACVAVAAAFKPQFLVFGALALWRRDFRFLLAFALVLGAALVASGLAYGWPAHVAYLRDVLPFLSRHGECYHTNQSVNGFLARALEPLPCPDNDPLADPSSPVRSSWFPAYHPVVYAATLASSLALLALPFLSKVRAGSARLADQGDFCLAVLAFTMASPVAWVHHYNVALPCFVVAIALLRERWPGWRPARRASALVLLAAAFVAMAIEWAPAYAPTDPADNLRQSHLFWGALLLVGLAAAACRVDVPWRRRSA